MEEQHKWHMERQQYRTINTTLLNITVKYNRNPDCIHLTLMPSHSQTKVQFITDLKASIAAVKANPKLAKSGTAGMKFEIFVYLAISNFCGSYVRNDGKNSRRRYSR